MALQLTDDQRADILAQLASIGNGTQPEPDVTDYPSPTAEMEAEADAEYAEDPDEERPCLVCGEPGVGPCDCTADPDEPALEDGDSSAKGGVHPDEEPDTKGDAHPFLVEVERKPLLDAATQLVRIIGRRSPLPILQGIRVMLNEAGNLVLTATDLEITGRKFITPDRLIDGYTGVPAMVVPGKVLRDLLKTSSSDTIEFGATPDGKVIVGPAVIQGLPVEDYPLIPPVANTDDSLLLTPTQGEEMSEAFRRVVVASSKDDARPILTGVHFGEEGGNLRLVATDSYRLAYQDTSVPFDPKGDLGGNRRHPVAPLVPRRAVIEIPRFTGHISRISRDGQNIALVGPEGVLNVRLIEGTFPAYRKLLPKQTALTTELQFPMLEMRDAINQMKALAEDHIPIQVKPEAAGVTLGVTRQDVGDIRDLIVPGSETVRSDIEVIAFNADYLRGGVTAGETRKTRMTGVTVTLEAQDNLKPVFLTNDEMEGFRYLLMPVRL
jgi:DNA polymerase-3 subunit beta